MRPFRFSPAFSQTQAFTRGDGIIVIAIVAFLYVGQRLAFDAPAVITGPNISLSPSALPWYAFFSVGRMAAGYIVSLLFSICYGYIAVNNRTARLVLMPLLDVLQSIPILSFLPVILLSFTALMPDVLAAELSAIVLIFTSQAWNMTFSFYQSMTTIPTELKEASAIFRFNRWTRLRTMEMPFAAIGLLWNSMMSWSGGWFFLMAAEIFRIGNRDFRLPGLGSYLQTAASLGDTRAVLMGVGVLICIIVVLDQFVWRPLIAWADKFKVEMLERDEPPTSWFYDILTNSWLIDLLSRRIWMPLTEWIDDRFQSISRGQTAESSSEGEGKSFPFLGVAIGLGIFALYGCWRAAQLLWDLPLHVWSELAIGLLATLLRVGVSLVLALMWTVPLGVLIGTNRRLANFLQPLVQVVAAIPATALFPILLLALITVRGGLNIAAVSLMLMGTQWYLLFNVIAGAAAIPQDLIHTTKLLGLSFFDRWRVLLLPALFPYIITGAITASGGAWNASIVAEYVEFGGQTHSVTGIGSIIARATGKDDYTLLLAATLALVITVMIINRTIWLRLYRIAEERYRME